MPYTIFSTPKKIKFISKFLQSQGLVVENTDIPEYIVTIRDPKDYLPKNLLENNTVRISPFDEHYASFLQNSRRLSKILHEKEQYFIGETIRIVAGTYKDFIGIIKKVNRKSCDIEISVFGKLIVDTLTFEEIEPLEKKTFT